MIKKIINALSIELDTMFDGVPIYFDEDVSQGFENPSFFLHPLEASQVEYVGGRFIREYPFDVCYFPATTGNNAEMINVAEKLFKGLWFIGTKPNRYRGFNMSYQIIDSVLHFNVNYRTIVRTIAEQEQLMQEKEIKIDAKKD